MFLVALVWLEIAYLFGPTMFYYDNDLVIKITHAEVQLSSLTSGFCA